MTGSPRPRATRITRRTWSTGRAFSIAADNVRLDSRLAKLDTSTPWRHACARRGDLASTRWNAPSTSSPSPPASIRSNSAGAPTPSATPTTTSPSPRLRIEACYVDAADAFDWRRRGLAQALDARVRRAGRLGHGKRRVGRHDDAEQCARDPEGRREPCRRDCGARHRHGHLHHPRSRSPPTPWVWRWKR